MAGTKISLLVIHRGCILIKWNSPILITSTNYNSPQCYLAVITYCNAKKQTIASRQKQCLLTSLNTSGKSPQFKVTLQHLSSRFLVSLPLSANGLLKDAILFQLAMWIFHFHMHTVIGACDHNVIS